MHHIILIIQQINWLTWKCTHTGLHPYFKQERKRPLDTPKRMIDRREREGERERERKE